MKGTFELRPEQWVLFGAFIFLAVVALVKAMTLPDINAAGDGGRRTQPESYETAKIEKISERLTQPSAIQDTDHKVYVSRLVVYKPSTQVIEPLADDGEIKGMKVGWLKQHELSLEDPNVDISDPDQDGFNNKEEHDLGTNPVDFEDHPDFIQKLCLKEYEFVPFKMRLMGYNPDVNTGELIYQIKLPEVQRRGTRMVKKDDDIEGYVIGEFRKKIVERYNPATKITEKVNVSELDVMHPILKTPVTLIYDTEIESDESRVVFHLKVPNLSPEPASVKRGETFVVDSVSYQFMSATETTALVRQVDNGQEFTINSCE